MSDLEDRIPEIKSLNQNIKKKQVFKNKNSLRYLWDNIKGTKICIISVPEREETLKGLENISDEIMAESYPNLKKETDGQKNEAQQVQNEINPETKPRGIINKW